jgi:alanine-glyoxylate transaminase/serine-glyoxylate transaminase/serine-pyruvate transaminase
MPGRHFLFVPGPTNVPDRIMRAMMVAMEDHRSPKFPELVLPVLSDLKSIFRTTTGRTFVFPATGTGAWEASLTNTLSPGDKVLASRYGQFSHLWIDMAKRLGLDVQVLEEEWGTGVDADRVESVLRADTSHAIKAVLAVHNETTTGVTSDIGAVRRAMDAAKHPAMLYVDGVSSIGSIDFRFDDWRVDLAVTGSQKGLMMPAGLGILCASTRAVEASKTAGLRRVFFDFADMMRANETGYFPYTPALPMLYGLRESLAMIAEEKLEHVIQRHHVLASGVRAAVKAWGLDLCAKGNQWHSDTVSAIMVPPGFNGADVIDAAYRRYNLSLGAGLSQVAGKLFRIGHLGDLNDLMVLGALSGAEMAMRDVGIDVKLGSGVAAAQAHFRSTIMQKEKKPSAQERFAELHPEGVVND